MKGFDFRALKQLCNEKFSEYNESVQYLRKALSNHTTHITALKKAQDTKASQKDLHEIKERMKTFAQLSDYKELYEKVVPPVAVMEDVGNRMQTEVEVLKRIVEQYDIDLTTKANKAEVLTLDS